MELPITRLRQEYADEIKVIEANIKDIASGTAPEELYKYSQDKLDKLAERYQNAKQLGTARYKLYELQALLYYFQDRDEDALAFIHEAIEAKGGSYKRAEQLIDQIESAPAKPQGHVRHNSNKSGNQALPLQLQAYIKGLRSSAIVMAVLSAITIIFIPWTIFYIVLATKLKPEKLPNRSLIKGAAIATLPLCTGIIPIFVDIEFWKMNKRLKEYEEKGSKAFISDEEFLKGEPKRKKRSVIAWTILLSIIALFIVLIVVAIASSDSSTSTSGNTEASNLSSEAQDAYQRMESLRSQYESCSSEIESRRGSVDTNSDYEVDSYNSDYDDCEDTRLRLNSTVDEYNRLAGYQ